MRLIFDLYVRQQKNERIIARILNENGIRNGRGGQWRHNAILRTLSNEIYIGNNVWNRSSYKLQSARIYNDPGQWIRAEGVFPKIVDRDVFEAAQRILQTRGETTIAGRPRKLSNDEMLRQLRALFQTYGYLSRSLIDSHTELPSAEAYFRRFGGLKRAFELVGAQHRMRRGFTRSGRPCGLSNDAMLDALRQLWKEHGYLTEGIIRTSQSAPNVSAYFTRFGSLRNAYRLIGFVPDRERTRPPRMVRGTSNEALLDILRNLLRQHGRLSKPIIDGNETGPCHGTIAFRFGGLLRAYALIGYTSHWYGERHVRPHGLSDQEMLSALQKVLQDYGYISQKLMRKVTSLPSYYEYCRRFGSLSAAYERIGFTPTTHPERRLPIARDIA